MYLFFASFGATVAVQVFLIKALALDEECKTVFGFVSAHHPSNCCIDLIH